MMHRSAERLPAGSQAASHHEPVLYRRRCFACGQLPSRHHDVTARALQHVSDGLAGISPDAWQSVHASVAKSPNVTETLTAITGGQDVKAYLQGIVDQAAALGPAGDLLFVAVYALAVTLFIPASVLTLGAGGTYGALHGTALASAGSTLGCALSFLVSRYLARPLAEERLKGNKLFQRLESRIPERGPKLVLLLRLTPLVPFGLLNYMCGLTSLQLLEYTAASWAGMLPGTFAYVYLGAAGTQTLSAAGDASISTQTIVQVIGAIAAILVVREVSKLASEAVGDIEQD